MRTLLPGLLFALLVCGAQDELSRFLAGTGTVTLHAVSETGQPDTGAKVIRLIRLDATGKRTNANFVSKFIGLTAQLQYGRYHYDVTCRSRGTGGTLAVFSPKVFVLVDCGSRNSEMGDGSGGPLFVNRGRVVPAPVAGGRSWITFVSSTGFGGALVENNQPLTVPVAADGSFEVYGLREGRYVALLFRDGDLMSSLEIQLDTISDPRPILLRLDGKPPQSRGTLQKGAIRGR